jgi:plastocyanin
VTAALKVEGGESTGELPSTPATVTATEYKFQATGLKAGKNTIRFANDGEQLHHIIAFQAAPGKTVADLKKFFASQGQPSGPPPFVEGSETGTAVIDGGTEQVTDLTLAKPGNWVLVCFISDRKGGPPHVAKGMITPVTVQ